MLDYLQDDSTKLGLASRGESKHSLSRRSQGGQSQPARVKVKCLPALAFPLLVDPRLSECHFRFPQGHLPFSTFGGHLPFPTHWLCCRQHTQS